MAVDETPEEEAGKVIERSKGEAAGDWGRDVADAAATTALEVGNAAAGGILPTGGLKKVWELVTGKGSVTDQAVFGMWLQWSTEEQVKIRRLLEAQQKDPECDPSPENIAAVLKAIGAASQKTGNMKKRELLRHAAVNAFDPRFAREGLVLQLLGFVEELHYNDISVLRRLVQFGRDFYEREGRTPEKHRLRVPLQQREHDGRQWKSTTQRAPEMETIATPTTLDGLSAARLMEAGLLSPGDNRQHRTVTQMGLELFAFLQEPIEGENSEDPDDRD